MSLAHNVNNSTQLRLRTLVNYGSPRQKERERGREINEVAKRDRQMEV
jgi:hypothetical protein